MKRSERTYNQLFALLRDTQQTSSLTPEEVQSLLDRPSSATLDEAPRTAPILTGRAIAIVIAVLTVSAVSIWLAPSTDSSQGSIPASPLRASAPAQQKNVNQGPQQTLPSAAAPATAANRVAAQPATPSVAEATPVTPPSASHRSASSHAATPMVERESSLPTNDVTRDSMNMAEKRTPRHLEAATFTMLELNPEELKALGVTFVDGGIETAGEEYYTLATAQDREIFARMGMDTTQRTGIVRMSLSIDTSGLTTKKRSWSRVEDYSRIAPIMALNSYVKDGRTAAAAINSFTRSPIMDSAKRSIGPMVSVLAQAFTSDNTEMVLHDIEQANPARILVPVHIRLGDTSANNTTKRRGADIILWYYPTPEFAAALPPRYRFALQKELKAIAEVVECNLPPVEVCRQMTGEPLLLNYCKRTSGALRGLNISPNPAHGSVTVRYMLETARTIDAALYGIRGEYIRELLPASTAGAGMHSAEIALQKVPPGAYVIVLRSEHGEQVAERLIVQ